MKLMAPWPMPAPAPVLPCVPQVYGGVVYMDFDEQYMAGSGGVGRYTRLDPSLLPPLHLMYSSHPSESGKVRGSMRAGWGLDGADAWWAVFAAAAYA